MHTIFHIIWGMSKHVAFGYLVYSLVQHKRGRSPTGRTTSMLLFGIAFPDLIDKTLTLAGAVGYGRSFAHSLITASAIIVVTTLLARRWNRADSGTAFAVGYLLHIPVDMYGPLLTGKYSMDTAFLFWPVVVEHPLGVMTPELPVSRNAIFSVVIASAFCLWLYDRMPVVSDIARFSYSRLGARGEKTGERDAGDESRPDRVR